METRATGRAAPDTGVPTIRLPSGEAVPVLGQGTWKMGGNARQRRREIEALRLGVDLGMTLIDTAEIYAEGDAERIVAEAIAGRREEAFLVTKVQPRHATRRGTFAACEGSLGRLRTDRIDLYLLHWPGRVPLEETVDAFEELVRVRKIRYWGVSNFDLSEMRELATLPAGSKVASNQVLYNLARRGIEWDLLPWCRERGIPIMAYTPFGDGRMLDRRALREVAERRGATPAQVALAWILRQDGVLAIPKAGRPEHVRENRAALEVHLTEEDLAELDRAFPPPHGPRALETA